MLPGELLQAVSAFPGASHVRRPEDEELAEGVGGRKKGDRLVDVGMTILVGQAIADGDDGEQGLPGGVGLDVGVDGLDDTLGRGARLRAARQPCMDDFGYARVVPSDNSIRGIASVAFEVDLEAGVGGEGDHLVPRCPIEQGCQVDGGEETVCCCPIGVITLSKWQQVGIASPTEVPTIRDHFVLSVKVVAGEVLQQGGEEVVELNVGRPTHRVVTTIGRLSPEIEMLHG